MPDVIKESKPIARKEHRCDYCGLKIEKGKLYERKVLKYNGVYNWKNHIHCHQLTLKMDMWRDCGHEGLSGDDFQMELIEGFYGDTGINVGLKRDDISRCIDYFTKKFNIKRD